MGTPTDQYLADVIYVEYWQVEAILETAAEHGVQVDDLLQQIGLTDGLKGTELNTRLRLSDYFRLQRDIARALDDLTAHLSERKLTYQTGQFVVEQMKRSVTLQDAIHCLVEHFNMMHGDAYNSVRQSGSNLTLVVDDTAFPYTFRDDEQLTNFVGDALLIRVHCVLDSIGKGLANRALRRVSLQRQRNEIGDGQVRFWTVPVQFGRPVYELVYDFETACQPIPALESIDLSTDGIFARAIDYLDAHHPAADNRPIAVRVKELVAGGCDGQLAVAQRLQISVATLRRRLADENMNFRDLVTETRLKPAERLLEKGMPVSQVSEKLGYSDIRAFNRAFKKWKGLTPAAFASTVGPNTVV